MSNRNSHTGKSIRQRNEYSKYINKHDYEPTLNESLQFNNTENPEEDFSESETSQKRPSRRS